MPPWDAPILAGDHPLSGKEDINAPVGNCQMVITRCRIRAELMEGPVFLREEIGEIARREQTVGAGFVGQATLQAEQPGTSLRSRTQPRLQKRHKAGWRSGVGQG